MTGDKRHLSDLGCHWCSPFTLVWFPDWKWLPIEKQATWHNSLFWKPVLFNPGKLESSDHGAPVTFALPTPGRKRVPEGQADSSGEMPCVRIQMGVRCAFLLCIGGYFLGPVGVSKISSEQWLAISLQRAFLSSLRCFWGLSVLAILTPQL